jgi:hypothetical protein
VLVRECVTVVRPGETLVVRVSDNTTPNQLRELQEYGDLLAGARGFSVFVAWGRELGVAESAVVANG